MSERRKKSEFGRPKSEVKSEAERPNAEVKPGAKKHSAPDNYREDIQHSEIEQLPTVNSNPDSYRESTEKMEVHHHPEVEKRGFKEYILEGLMIFLAVTMGFFAENLREKITDNRKIHEYAQSMARDLESDISLYKSSIDFNRQSAQMIDTIITSLTEHKNNKSKVYFMARTLTMGLSVITPNEKTFEQMKSSGTIRLIRHQRIADSIASYYQWANKFDYWSDLQRQRMNDLLNANDKIFDAAVFYSIAKEMRDPKKSITNLPPDLKLTSSDPILINAVIMRYQYYYGMLNIMSQHASRASIQASQLIQLLKKEYNLEDE